MRACLFSLLLLLSLGSVLAEPLAPEEQALLDETRNRFVEAMTRRDFGYTISAVPPRLMAHIADAAGVPVDVLVASLPALMDRTMAGISFTNIHMMTEDLDAERTVSDGEEYVWGFAPSSIDITVEGMHFNASGHTFVLLDGGSWYLVRTSETDKLDMLRGLYPFLSDVDFPEETLTRTD